MILLRLVRRCPGQGTSMVLNQLVAYRMLGARQATLDPRSVTIVTFALCGFANLSSIGIQIGDLNSDSGP
jgi:CNT family concentrative nucleoside transporter